MRCVEMRRIKIPGWRSERIFAHFLPFAHFLQFPKTCPVLLSCFFDRLRTFCAFPKNLPVLFFSQLGNYLAKPILSMVPMLQHCWARWQR